MTTGTAAHIEGRLAWRCRRGMRELDTLLSRYLETQYPKADAAERQSFEAILDLTDPEIWALVLGQSESSDPQTRHVIEHIAAAHPRA